jgi:hypothetical protein
LVHGGKIEVETSEFQEIGHSGGKITVHFKKPDKIGLGFSNSTPGSLFQVGVALDGGRLEYWPLSGMNMREPKPPSPMVGALVISDREQLFGRACPKCRSYFRTSRPGEVIRCPYCAHLDRNVAFTTKNQLLFINKIRESYLSAIKQEKSIEIDLNRLADELPENKPQWIYSEEKQQNCFKCPGCETRYDILGEYGGCPHCGKRNALQVFEKHATEIETQLSTADSELKDRQEREIEWEKLLRCVSDFEAMARDIQAQLLLFPATPRRKKEIESLSFQNLIKANESVQHWFGFEMLFHVCDKDKVFLNQMFNRRHVLTHNGGRIDHEYVKNTNDTTVRLNQKIVVRSNELRRLLPLLRDCARKLFEGFESIS